MTGAVLLSCFFALNTKKGVLELLHGDLCKPETEGPGRVVSRARQRFARSVPPASFLDCAFSIQKKYVGSVEKV